MGKAAGGTQWYEKSLLLIMNYSVSTHIHTHIYYMYARY